MIEMRNKCNDGVDTELGAILTEHLENKIKTIHACSCQIVYHYDNNVNFQFITRVATKHINTIPTAHGLEYECVSTRAYYFINCRNHTVADSDLFIKHNEFISAYLVPTGFQTLEPV